MLLAHAHTRGPAGKARAYLMWKGVPFEEVAASRDIYMSFIVPRTGVVFVPVLASPDWSEVRRWPRTRHAVPRKEVARRGAGARLIECALARRAHWLHVCAQVVQDTSCIVDYIEARHPARPAIPPSPRRRVVSRLMETFADEWLVMAAMHYRWSFPEQRTYMQMVRPVAPSHPSRCDQCVRHDRARAWVQEFGKMVDPTCSAAEQLKLGARTMRPFAGALTMLGVTDATKAAVRQRARVRFALVCVHARACAVACCCALAHGCVLVLSCGCACVKVPRHT